MPDKIQSFLTLQAQKIQALSNIEILDIIDNDTLSRIKEKDPHPFFQAYSICHEGTSTPNLIGDTARPISWIKKAIQSIKNIVTKGVKFFKGHNSDNSTEGRREIGEVVADTQREINGVLHHIVIGYHPPEVKEEVKNYDICSQEANWNFIQAGKNLIADTIDKLTGIALGNSNNEKPAFSGAKRLGMVQAFNSAGDAGNKDKTGEYKMPDKVDLTTIPFQELTEELKRRNTFPHQLYKLEDIKNDRVFSEPFSKLEKLENENKVLIEEKQKLTRSQELSTAKTRLDTIIKGLNIDEKKSKLIYDNFNENSVDLSDDALKNYVNSEVDKINKYASIFTTNESSIDLGTGDNQEPGENKNPDDYTKAENNPLLEEDYTEAE